MPNPAQECEIVVADPDALRDGFVKLVHDDAAAAIASRGRFTLAVPGGSVATVLLGGLGADDVPWQSTDLFWCDERVVPPDDPASNYGAACAGWLRPIIDAGVRLHPMVAADAPVDAASERYAQLLATMLGTPPVLDVMVIGVGPDGHICSLFPGLPALDVRDRWVVAVSDAPKLPRQRLTMTLPVVTAARRLVVAAFGSGKRHVMRCAIEEPTCLLPVARVLREARNVVVLLDEGSASRLSLFRRASGT